jgi:hypothetical protein
VRGMITAAAAMAGPSRRLWRCRILIRPGWPHEERNGPRQLSIFRLFCRQLLLARGAEAALVVGPEGFCVRIS